MRYFLPFFISLSTFLTPSSLSGFTVKIIDYETRVFSYDSGEEKKLGKQIGYTEDPSYLFDSIKQHKFFSADFKQVTVKGKKRRIVEGRIKANRSGQFKISYKEPLNEIMFSDGKDFYRYDPELEQVNIQPLDQLLSETPMGLLTLNLDKIRELFTVSECWKRLNQYTCLLNSKNEESFIKWVYITLKNRVFSSLKYLDSFDQEISLQFKNSSTKQLNDEEFRLVIPKETDIVSYENNIN